MGGVSCLSSNQFQGRPVSAEAPTLEGGQSTYEGSIAVTLIPRDLVRDALPNGFVLADRTDDDVSTHPVVHMIGFQASPMLLLNGDVTPAPDPGYTELIVLIPYVVKRGGSCWHSFVVRMYLNDEAAIFIGNTYYSYRKAFASFAQSASASQTSTEVSPFLEGDVFKSAVTRTGDWTPCGDPAVPLFDDIRTMLAMPLLGAFVDGSNEPLQTICSYWEWDFRCAEVAAAMSDHDFLAKVAPGAAGWIGTGGPSNPAMQVRGLRWRIPLPPEQCQF
jgi:hypothetical protein